MTVDVKRPEMNLDMLENSVELELSLDELRIILGCFRAVAYQMEMDDEPYLDATSFQLKERLEGLYGGMMKSLKAAGESLLFQSCKEIE